jgi:hypothetical protein
MEVERNLMRLASLSVTLVVLLAIIGCGGGSTGGGDSGKDLLQEVKDRGVLRVSTDPASRRSPSRPRAAISRAST